MFANFFKKSIKEKDLVFWWEPSDGSHNAGDHLAKIIVKQMLTIADKEILDKKDYSNKLLSIGSVMHFANSNDCIWGTGINGKISDSHLKFNDLDVRAVRGPLTQEFLNKRDISVPSVFGDPGLLLPVFFSKDLLLSDSNVKANDFIVIPHMNEDFTIYDKFKNNICSPKQGALSFTKEIVNSKFVVSCSLHGLIIAEAYGIPAVFLQNESGESRFKYDDYYFGTGRDSYPIAKTVDQALNLSPAKTIDHSSITKSLMQSFPYDLW
ncbi:polysaccharide pyruvyl transferase family protein [Klebsiella pneumoniae]|uniref:Polysaccharide pyruvyl transferase n=1 Tax=Klebsiella pneumoniae TaxID=573 RepID=A0A193SEP3_KLEPN|nr:polysaccharide pyruvyl transferase family protein [Klebsiella pneumoniae]EIV5397977.1 polysaccharide pyruvyl transferase family protein [Klebsiella pneumoniae]EIV5544244.1 polysaccharide pyruvyl transferase family protein [Klebsiella pneumoniae]EIX9262529.1 polysaccharide pyruvyl transferase family protein [Klebsiella pneumoniae]EIX9404604.1 polysaccharide pyruvyl transferase family protein [Klebsiella pneumoniae]EKU0734549.1 polysaccharide pyruvyl transferase family protein [Klebsiella pne